MKEIHVADVDILGLIRHKTTHKRYLYQSATWPLTQEFLYQFGTRLSLYKRYNGFFIIFVVKALKSIIFVTSYRGLKYLSQSWVITLYNNVQYDMHCAVTIIISKWVLNIFLCGSLCSSLFDSDPKFSLRPSKVINTPVKHWVHTALRRLCGQQLTIISALNFLVINHFLVLKTV